MTEPVSCANWPHSVRGSMPASQYAQAVEVAESLQAEGVAALAGLGSRLELEETERIHWL
jgi:hypothetical protein